MAKKEKATLIVDGRELKLDVIKGSEGERAVDISSLRSAVICRGLPCSWIVSFDYPNIVRPDYSVKCKHNAPAPYLGGVLESQRSRLS